MPYKKGASALRFLPTYEQWLLDILGEGDFNDYWKQRGYAIDHYYDEHADVPTIYLGGWYDSYARGTTNNYVALSKRMSSPQRLIMGPWTHGLERESGELLYPEIAHDTFLFDMFVDMV